MKFVGKLRCFKCGREIDKEEEEYCKECKENVRTYKRGYPLLIYDELSSSIMYDFKYNNKRNYGKIFARLIYERYKEKLLRENIDILIPVPIHKKRYKERGYNQASIISKELSSLLKINSDDNILLRKKNTKALKNLTKKEREESLKDAFLLKKDALKKVSKVLLVDDIYTTGSSIEACTRILREYKDIEVYYTSICIV